jgi:NAD(P)-dependent dehydrogenase (short-subunit alcohol dehydrogenase family)
MEALGRLEGAVAVVTGAASGIGRAIARKFAAEGASVIVADVVEEPIEGGERTVDLIADAKGVAEFQRTDVARWDDVDRVVTHAVERYGKLDIMVNNAAVFTDCALLETSEEDWQRTMAVNVTGVFFGCKRAVQQMLKQPARGDARGRIVNISSQHGMIRCPGDIAYGVGKSSVVYMTRQIAADYADQHIICNAVAPGKILTGRGGDAVSESSLAYANARTPMPRLGRPIDVANAATFLASDECTYMKGVNLMVDGGWSAA